MRALYQIDLQGFLLAIDKLIADLPHPLNGVLEPYAVLKQILPISIGYQDRRKLVDTQLGQTLCAAQMIPYQVDEFIATALKVVEDLLYGYGQLRLHYSDHTYELGHWLLVYETDSVKPVNRYIHPAEQTEYHRRLQREAELEQEREEAYAIESSRYGQSHYQFGR